jgi:hypothetical protein
MPDAQASMDDVIDARVLGHYLRLVAHEAPQLPAIIAGHRGASEATLPNPVVIRVALQQQTKSGRILCIVVLSSGVAPTKLYAWSLFSH